MSVNLLHGDCRDRMRELDADSVDAIARARIDFAQRMGHQPSLLAEVET